MKDYNTVHPIPDWTIAQPRRHFRDIGRPFPYRPGEGEEVASGL